MSTLPCDLPTLNVVYFQRRPSTTFHFSIERLFGTVRAALPHDVRSTVATCRFESAGLCRRVYNSLEAVLRQGDVNHITGDVSYLACLLQRKRTVLTILDCGTMNRLHGWRKWFFRLLWLRLPAHRSAVITTISEFSKSEILRYIGCSPDKVHVISVPLNSEFRPAPAEFHAACPVVLQVGTQPNKNLERVAEALAGIKCHFRIIGTLSQSQIDILQTHSIAFSNTSSLSDAELLQEFGRCDMVVFASLYEGFGMPIVEGNAVGRPVITSRLCSMPEVAGDAACLVDPNDVASIRAGIVRIIADSVYRESLVKNGYANAARFAGLSIARQYSNVYSSLAACS